PPGGTAEGLSTALTRTGARLVVGAIGGHDEVVADLGAVSAAVAEDGTLAAIGELAPPPAPSRRPPGLDRAHFVTFTSGSTGTPKAVVHTADTMAYSARHSVERTGAGAGAVLGLVALSHAAGLAFSVFAALPQGRDLVLYDGRWAPGRALDMVDGHGVAWTLSVPTHLSDMVTAAEERDWSPGPGGLTFACGGASVSPDLVRSAAARGIAVCRMYGLSECLGHTATHRDEPVEVRAAHDGTVFPGSEVVTLDADGTVLPPGSPGQGASTGPALFLGYLEDETDHEALTAEGHLPTGDLMEVDEDGRVAVVGRVKDIIIRGGENVDPGQVEADVVGHPAVRRAAAVGYPDPRLGERICVWVETDDGALDRDGLATFLLGRGVPKLRIPDMVRVLERLPVSAVGKIDKRALRKTIEEVQQ
uniref:class I adenylate-forming enzyme family protein n=1 Tax=Pseudonocardia pini TaxID=2758030 RepID=UPI0015F017A9